MIMYGVLGFISLGLWIPNMETQNYNRDSGNGTKVTRGVVHGNQNHFIRPEPRVCGGLFVAGDQGSYYIVFTTLNHLPQL
jgi:hypothetical protein